MLFGQDEAVAEYVGGMLGTVIHPPFTAIGFLRDGVLTGGAVFNGYNGANIELTLYCPNVSRGTIRAMVHYAFVQVGCIRVTAKTRRANKRACQTIDKAGFTFEAVLRHFFGPQKADDAIVYRLDREIALPRWLGLK